MSKNKRGETLRLCRCDCGTERYVLERSLRAGGSTNCGCVRRETTRQKLSYELTGKRFGSLTVIGPSEKPHKSGGVYWSCRCDCGNICEYQSTLLVTGKRTHCGCKRTSGFKDISGQRFSRLTALFPTDKRDEKGTIVWHCRCECGNELDVSYNELMYSRRESCGCKKLEHNKLLGSLQARADGTSIDIIRSNSPPIDNTSGVRGVYLVRGKYLAKIVFQQKPYYLGSYDTLEKAAEARRIAEDELYGPTIEFHEKWKSRAEVDPGWASENPMRIFVSREDGEFHVDFLPLLD